jgi:prepilin signal peptidase PulO-like enzyme (type II secretory pathway)
MESAMQIVMFLFFAIPITFFDLKDLRIPDVLSLGGTAFFAVWKIARGTSTVGMVALECGVGFGLFFLIHLVTRGRMGLGDAKYSALIAAAAGLLPWLVTLLIASVAGAVFAIIMISFFGMDRRARIPFAPFLSLGAVLAVALRGLYGGRIG